MRKIVVITLALFMGLTPLFSSQALEFNPNYIISDAEILDTAGMTLAEVQRFLDAKPGILKNYDVIVDIIDEPLGMQPAAEFIYTRSIKNGINPKFTLVLLQKEQSLITEPNPSQRDLDFAAGYGCPDSGACSERWRGFSKQVNSATLQFKDYMDNPQSYNYKAGQTYTISNTGRGATVVTPANIATAGLYNYTPHVYNGNYNFWKIWNEWFSLAYPDGSLLQAKGDPVVYLVKYGLKRPFKSKAALASRYSLDKIIQVDASILEQYSTGEPIKYPQYALYRSPQGTVYMIIDDVKHGFKSAEVLKTIGINPEEIENIDQATIDSITEGKPITLDSAYPMGALLQNKASGTVFYVKDGKKYPLVHKDVMTVNFGLKPIISQVTGDELQKYVAMPPLYVNDGELITSEDADKPAVYVISDGIKRPVMSGEAFESLGYKWENVKSVINSVVDMHPSGEPLDYIN